MLLVKTSSLVLSREKNFKWQNMEKFKHDGEILFGVKGINTLSRHRGQAGSATATRLLLILHIFCWFTVKNKVPFKPSKPTS